MKPEQQALIGKAETSLRAARLLADNSYYDSAISEAYYVMFYCAKALILGKGLTHSKHSAVISAFGQHLAKPGLVPTELHRFILEAQQHRLVADYTGDLRMTPDTTERDIQHAEAFLRRTKANLADDAYND